MEQPSQHSPGFTESTQLPKPTWSEPSVSASAPFRYAVEHRESKFADILFQLLKIIGSKITVISYSLSTMEQNTIKACVRVRMGVIYV